MRPLARKQLVFSLMAGVLLSLTTVPPAHADTDWVCTDPSGIWGNTICIRVFAAGTHHNIRGVDIKLLRFGQGCQSGHFSHAIYQVKYDLRGRHVNLRGIWHDDGLFTICHDEEKSYFW